MRLPIAIAAYLVSFLVFSGLATFGVEGWDIAYYLAQDIGGGGVLAWYVLYHELREQRPIILPVLLFSILVLLWDITSYLMKIGVNHPKAFGIGFGVAVLAIMYLYTKAILTSRKQ